MLKFLIFVCFKNFLFCNILSNYNQIEIFDGIRECCALLKTIIRKCHSWYPGKSYIWLFHTQVRMPVGQ